MVSITGWLTICALIASCAAKQPVAQYRPLPPLREQDALENKWVQMRYDRIPEILERHGYDAWILTMREYAEDTAFRALVSSTTQFWGRRRTMWMFHTNPNVTSPFHFVSLKDDLWDGLLDTLEQVNPKKIAINVDEDMAFSDGLHTGEGHKLMSKLGKWADRVTPCRDIGVEVIATRAGGKEQLEMYRLLQENVWAMIQEGFSERVIEIGKTTAEDLMWWFRETMVWKLGSRTWFHPSVEIHRSPDEPAVEDHPAMREGDMLHVDIGIYAMGMNTDTQHLGYILRSNETAPPQSLQDGLAIANKMQDFNRLEMRPGLTGDQVFWAIRGDMTKAKLNEHGRIYSHPIGDYGHSAGAVIGMADWQTSIPGGGENKVLKDYWTSVELAGVNYIPEWRREQNFELEEDVYWCEETDRFEWVFGQQTEFHLVQPKNRKHGHGHQHGHGHKHHDHEHKHAGHGHRHGHKNLGHHTEASWMSRVAAKLGWDIVRWI
ncbi:hypothetical protein BD324DRAFT_613868 [Kockovaella imperatae]|uniref:Peptidase M24 domain-containing protein n=1 Tax=Kockovaella imperatae TaxID=4999 RepID=A0A1Y1UUK8_9TREE|nr:hypothetical protein BD324DRAFT_613868 [Kockovaella imperatae]ORX41264.1 hypothetical protein BD324DRAFT_613868 [Kockovaella imperatae]